MIYRLEYSKKSVKQIKKLDKQDQERVLLFSNVLASVLVDMRSNQLLTNTLDCELENCE